MVHFGSQTWIVQQWLTMLRREHGVDQYLRERLRHSAYDIAGREDFNPFRVDVLRRADYRGVA